MKLLLFADKFVGLNISKYLLENYPEDLLLVVTKQRNEIFQLVEQCGIPVCVFETSGSLITRLTDEVDLGVLAWWPDILRSPLLEVPRYGFLNTHPSFLPYNRGKHYNFWAIVEQAPFGVTIHWADTRVDTGGIVAQKKIEYDWCDNGGTLYFRAQEETISLFFQTYPLVRIGVFDSIPQDQEIGSYHHSSEIDQVSEINLDRMYRARDLLNLLRARTFEGYPGCWFEESGSRFEISISIKKVGL